MGKMLLLLVAASTLAGAVVYTRGATAGERSGSAVATRQMARAVAEQLSATGLNEAAQWVSTLSAVPAVTTVFEGAQMGGTYRALAVPNGTGVDIVSVGTLPGVAGGAAAHTRSIGFSLASAAAAPAEVLPPFMQAALTMERMLTANGGVAVTSESPLVNANVHTNGAGQAGGGSVIQGFLRHAQPIGDAGIRQRLEAVILPNQNPDGLPDLQPVGRIEIPEFRAEAHRARATQVVSGNYVVSGTVTLGTRAAPSIILVTGDLTSQGAETRFVGYGILLVAGNVNINQSVRTDAGSESSLAVYTQGAVNINGQLTLTGQVFSNQDVNMSSQSVITGTVTTRSGVNFNGGGRIVYRPASAALTAPIFGQVAGTAAPAAARFRAKAYAAWPGAGAQSAGS